MESAPSAYQRFLPWRRTVEVGFWVAVTGGNAIGNSITVLIDVRRMDLDFASWEPAVWEWSSALLWLALIPCIAWFTRRWPLDWGTWRAQLPHYAAASIVVSVLHVTGMVALRELAYRWQGNDYDFGDWHAGLLYEYIKDVRSFASVILTIELYRLLLRRWQGEASLLDVPDEGPPVEPVGRPDRFLVRKLGREFLIAAGDIEWLQASGNYVNLHVASRDYPLRSTIAGVEARLDPQRFVRVHRSYIVNLERLASIEPLESGDARLHLKDGSTLPCSRRYRESLKARGSAR